MGQLHFFQKPKTINDEPIILVGHQRKVICLIVIKHNKLASSSEDITIKIWSLLTNQCLATLRGHKREVRSLIELKDNRIASGSDDHFVKLWCPKSFRCTATLTGHIDRVLCLTQINNDLIASYANNFCIKVWDISINKCIKTMLKYSASSYIIALKDERLVYFESYTIILCNTTTFQSSMELHSEIHCHQACFVELDDNKLVLGTINGFEVWDTLLGQCLYRMPKSNNSHDNYIKETQYLIKMNNGILVASNGICVKLWNINDYQCIQTPYLNNITCPVELEDGRIAFAAMDKTIQLINHLV